MQSLKQKTISGLTWSLIETLSSFGLTFFISIILARLLSPADFGLVGLTTIFFAISRTFIDSGFSQALIQKQDVTNEELSTVFYFNIFLGIIFFIIVFLAAASISNFLNEPQLENLIKVISTTLVIGSFSSIQQTVLIKRIDFKLQTKISVISTIVSGFVSITMAINNFAVWSLVFSSLISQIVSTYLLWRWNSWKPNLVFHFTALKALFSFGSKLMVSSLISTTFDNIYYLFIGKYHSAADLGFFSRADNFQKMASQNLTQVIQRVSFPVLASIQNDYVKLKEVYINLIRNIMFITFLLMFGIAGAAEQIILTLIGEKWLPSVQYLQMLCMVGVLYPLHAINLNMLNVQGRSDLFLKLELLKKALVIPIIVIGVVFGIKIMIIGMIVNSLIAYFINTTWSGSKIGYSRIHQLKDIFPSFIFALINGLLIFYTGKFLTINSAYEFIIQIFLSLFFVVTIGEIFKLKDYVFIKNIVVEQISNFRSKL